MNSIKYDKLIRDRIPEIIEIDGKKCVVEILDDKQYMNKLAEKLQEEMKEFLLEFSNENDEEAIKELADLEEVILSLKRADDVKRQSSEKID